MAFIDFDICQWIASLRLFYSVTLTNIFMAKYFKCSYLWNAESLREKSKIRLIAFYLCNRMERLRKSYVCKVKMTVNHWLASTAVALDVELLLFTYISITLYRCTLKCNVMTRYLFLTLYELNNVRLDMHRTLQLDMFLFNVSIY